MEEESVTSACCLVTPDGTDTASRVAAVLRRRTAGPRRVARAPDCDGLAPWPRAPQSGGRWPSPEHGRPGEDRAGVLLVSATQPPAFLLCLRGSPQAGGGVLVSSPNQQDVGEGGKQSDIPES